MQGLIEQIKVYRPRT